MSESSVVEALAKNHVLFEVAEGELERLKKIALELDMPVTKVFNAALLAGMSRLVALKKYRVRLAADVKPEPKKRRASTKKSAS